MEPSDSPDSADELNDPAVLEALAPQETLSEEKSSSLRQSREAVANELRESRQKAGERQAQAEQAKPINNRLRFLETNLNELGAQYQALDNLPQYFQQLFNFICSTPEPFDAPQDSPLRSVAVGPENKPIHGAYVRNHWSAPLGGLFNKSSRRFKKWCQQGQEVSNQIKAAIETERINSRDRYAAQLLLFGPKNSGKRTLMKQLQLLYGNGFTEEERMSIKQEIIEFTITSMQTLIGRVRETIRELSKPENDTHAMLLLDHVPSDGSIWNNEVAEHIYELWNDGIVRRFWLENCGPLGFQGCEPHFFENVNKFLQPDYIPLDQEYVVFPSSPSRCILDQTFKIGDSNIRFVDVGGMHTERRKWIHCFSEMTAIIFLVDASAYDLIYYSDYYTSAMAEALHMFAEVTSSHYLNQMCVITLFNKNDVFSKKIFVKDIKIWDPLFECKDKDDPALLERECGSFMQSRFQLKDQRRGQRAYYFPICINEAAQVKTLMEDKLRHEFWGHRSWSIGLLL